MLSDGNGYCEQEWELAKMPASDRGFGRVRNCDGMRAKGITPDEIDAYAAGEARRAPPEPGASRRAAGRLNVPLVLSPRSFPRRRAAQVKTCLRTISPSIFSIL